MKRHRRTVPIRNSPNPRLIYHCISIAVDENYKLLPKTTNKERNGKPNTNAKLKLADVIEHAEGIEVGPLRLPTAVCFR